jgi:hypothetical protein
VMVELCRFAQVSNRRIPDICRGSAVDAVCPHRKTLTTAGRRPSITDQFTAHTANLIKDSYLNENTATILCVEYSSETNHPRFPHLLLNRRFYCRSVFCFGEQILQLSYVERRLFKSTHARRNLTTSQVGRLLNPSCKLKRLSQSRFTNFCVLFGTQI